MPDYSVHVVLPSNKTPRSYYKSAYKALRQYYACCARGIYTDDQLMTIKLALWKAYGRYLDLAWEHHFARQVTEATGQGWAHGWRSVARREAWLDATYRKAIIAAGW